MIKKHLFWIIPLAFGLGIVEQYFNDLPQINNINNLANNLNTEIDRDTKQSIMITDLVGTNETKQEFVDHYCKQSHGFDLYGNGFCEDMIKNGAGSFGFNQTGGFLGQ